MKRLPPAQRLAGVRLAWRCAAVGLALRCAAVALAICAAACSSGQTAAIPSVAVPNIVQTSTLQFAVGTATIGLADGASTLGLNVVATFRQPNGNNATGVNTPTLSAPAAMNFGPLLGNGNRVAGVTPAQLAALVGQVKAQPAPTGTPYPLAAMTAAGFGPFVGVFGYGLAGDNLISNADLTTLLPHRLAHRGGNHTQSGRDAEPRFCLRPDACAVDCDRRGRFELCGGQRQSDGQR